MHENEAPGSTLYYSLLYCDPAKHDILRHYHRIYHKLKTLQPVAVTWWRNELQKTPELLPLLDAFEKDLAVHIYEDDAHVETFYKNTAGAFERILGHHYGVTDPVSLEHLEKLGIFIEKINHLQHLKKTLAKNKTYFSGEQLLKHRVNLYELSQGVITPDIRQLLNDHVAQTLSTFYTPNDKSLRPTLIMANIQKALLLEIQRSDFPLFTHHISLTPLRKWWIAIRS